MAEIVNLNRFRKAQARAEARRDAEANAAKFGRTKAQKKLEAAQAEAARRRLEGHERDSRHAGDCPNGGDTPPSPSDKAPSP